MPLLQSGYRVGLAPLWLRGETGDGEYLQVVGGGGGNDSGRATVVGDHKGRARAGGPGKAEHHILVHGRPGPRFARNYAEREETAHREWEDFPERDLRPTPVLPFQGEHAKGTVPPQHRRPRQRG